MSLFPIGAQPISFDTSPLAVKCKDPEAPLLIGAEDALLFQLGIGCCDDTEFIDNPNFQAGWVTSGRWTIEEGIAASTDGANQASIEYEDFQPTPFTSYCIAIQFDEVTGEGVRVTFGGVSFFVSDSGLFTATVVAQSDARLNIALISAGSVVQISSAQVSASPSAIELDLVGCEDNDVLFTTSISTGPQYFEILGNVLKVTIPMEDTDIEDGCFFVRLRYTCGDDTETLDSTTTLKVLTDCEKTIKLRVCNDSPQMGMAAGYFEMRIEASMVRPRWPMNLEEFRDSVGRIVRTQADSQTVWELHIERVGYLHHQFLRTLAMWDHLYLQGVEWAASGGDYNPLYSDATTFAAAIVELRPRQELLRAVRCDVLGAGCDPANDPICGTPNVVAGATIVGGANVIRVVVFDELGYIPSEIGWTLNGAEQTAEPYTGPGTYDLGPVQPGDTAVVRIMDATKPDCIATFGPVVVPFPDTNYFQFIVNGDASAGDFSAITTSTGFWTLTNNAGYSETIPVGGNPSVMSALQGPYIAYSSDSSGNPTGTIDDFLVFTVPIIPIDFSGLTDIVQFILEEAGITSPPNLPANAGLQEYQINNQGTAVMVTPPDLSGFPSITTLSLIDNGLTTAPNISGNLLLVIIEMSDNALTQTAVDNLFIQADALNLNGMFISVIGGTNAPPSAASAAARAAIISRGGSIFTN